MHVIENNFVKTRYEALMILGISSTATSEEIKKQYKLLSKQYHPDQNQSTYAKKYYIQVQQAYQYLKEHNNETVSETRYSQIYGYQNNRSMNTTMYGYYKDIYGYPSDYQKINNNINYYQNYARPSKILGNDKDAQLLHRRQVAFAEDKKRIENALKEKEVENNRKQDTPEQKEKNTLEAIRAIWLAEQIHRQIENDKLEKEKEQKRKLYKAFSQHDMLENEEKNDLSDFNVE